jgi:uncharacterized membrane protein YqhA
MRRLFETFLSLSRFVVLLPVVTLVVAATAAFVYGVAVFVNGVADVIAHPFPVGNRIGLFLLVIDLFLVGATLLIAAVGFYELFVARVAPEQRSGIPGWLRMDDLNDLKARVISMIVLVVAVAFVEFVVDQSAGIGVLEIGAGVALVITALVAFLRFGGRARGEG